MATTETAPPVEPAATPPGDPPSPGEAVERGPALPEVRVRTLGLHVGGGPNDAASHRPLRDAVERTFPAMLACFRLAEGAPRGGSFGVDLVVPRGGGRPEARQPRTALPGAQLRECLLSVFRSVEFAPPRRGKTVVSYSVAFDVGS